MYPLETERAATGDERGVTPPLIEFDVVFGPEDFSYKLEGSRIAWINGYKAVVHSSDGAGIEFEGSDVTFRSMRSTEVCEFEICAGLA